MFPRTRKGLVHIKRLPHDATTEQAAAIERA
jgi:hypothetical protein